MYRAGLDPWGRVIRDPYTLLLAAAAAVQLTLGSSSANVLHPGWAVAAIAVFAVACLSAVAGRIRGSAVLESFPPFALIVVAAFWRAADAPDLAGFGGLCIIAVIWLGFYGTRRQVWIAVGSSVVSMLLPPLLIGESAVPDDWRRAALTGAVAVLTGPAIRSLVERGAQSAQLVSVLEPAGLRFDAVLRAATGHLIIACDRDGTILEFNQGAERLLGYRADEVVGKTTPLLFHDPDENRDRAAEANIEPGFAVYVQAALRGEIEIRDWTLVTKDGRRVIVSLSITGIQDPDATITGFVAIGTDVTASRTTMQTLAAQREIYRLLVEHLPMTTVGLIDSDLRCVTIGGHWLAKIGAEPGRFRGTPVEEFFVEADRSRARELFERARSEPVTVQWDLADDRCYDFTALPLNSADGEQLILIVARDVSEQRRLDRERQQMHSALTMSEATLREAFEGAPIGMALISVEDGAEEKFQRVNPAFAAILGRRPEDLVGVRVVDVTHPEDVALQPDLHNGARTRAHRKRFLRPSGRTVWVEVNYAVVYDADRNPSHVITQIQDIHTMKESERALLDALEQQRAATARLSELDRIRTDLVGTISHELRTPLTSIHGYLELLGDETLTDGQHGMLDVAIRNTERLGDLVDNLLVLVRLDSVEQGGFAHGSDEVDIASTVAAAIDTVRPAMVDRRQRLEVSLPSEPAVVHGDFDQLDRVLVNLLSNASKYTPIGGRIDVDLTVHAGALRIVVADTGIGIPADEVQHLFTRFFRASTARANSISGNGLGLAIVKSIVERHGGAVSVESELGVGSRFTVSLPLSVHSGIGYGVDRAAS